MLNNILGKGPTNYGGVEFWHSPERTGWLMKQGEYIKTWRRRWFVLKQGRIFWFKTDYVTPDSIPRGIIEVEKCLSIKGAEDVVNKPHAFEISTNSESMFYIADTDKEKVLDFVCYCTKTRDKNTNTTALFDIDLILDDQYTVRQEDWINAVGRAIVRHSKSMLEHEQSDYDYKS